MRTCGTSPCRRSRTDRSASCLLAALSLAVAFTARADPPQATAVIELASSRGAVWIPIRMGDASRCVPWSVQSASPQSGFLTTTWATACAHWNIGMRFESEGTTLRLREPYGSYTKATTHENVHRGGAMSRLPKEPLWLKVAFRGVNGDVVHTSVGDWYLSHEACSSSLADGTDPATPLFDRLPRMLASSDPYEPEASAAIERLGELMKQGNTVHRLDKSRPDDHCTPLKVQAVNWGDRIRVTLTRERKDGRDRIRTRDELEVSRCGEASMFAPRIDTFDADTGEEILPRSPLTGEILHPPRRPVPWRSIGELAQLRSMPDGGLEIGTTLYYGSTRPCEAARRQLRRGK